MLLWSVYFAEDRCEESEHGALVDDTRYIPSRHITTVPVEMAIFYKYTFVQKSTVNIYIRRRFTHILNDLSKVTTVVTRSFLAALFSHVKYFYIFVAK